MVLALKKGLIFQVIEKRNPSCFLLADIYYLTELIYTISLWDS